MGIALLKSFVMPKRLVLEDGSASETYGKFIAEPFERGYGRTLGNSLRRVLLSSIEGAAVSSVKIDGVQHEFSEVPGVQEDVSEIVLNLKGLILRSHTRAPKIVTLKADQKGEVTAKDIVVDDTIEILNPDHVIATITKKTELNMDIEVSKGRGFVTADLNKKEGHPIGTIAIDSAFSPVRRVAYTVEDTRVGQITDYDRLVIEVWTNGSITPKDAILYASNIYQQQLNVFVNFGKLPEEELVGEPETTVEDAEMIKKYSQPVSELELSVRSANCLNEARIKTIGDLVSQSEADMLKYRNFGKKSLTEISQILKNMGLRFGMPVPKEVRTQPDK